MENEMIQARADSPLSVKDIREQINLIQGVMKDAMQDKVHFGTIPGCGDKPTLLKPGAEKLSLKLNNFISSIYKSKNSQ